MRPHTAPGPASAVREALVSPLINDERAGLIRAGLGLPVDGTRINIGLLGGFPAASGELVDVAINRDTATVLTLTLEDDHRRTVVPWHAIATVTTVPTNPGHPAL